MPRLSPALGVIITAALCIGLAAFRYPQVNQQVREMVQAGRQRSANGETGFLQFGLAVPAKATLAQAEEAQRRQVPSVNDGALASEEGDLEAIPFIPAPIAGYVGTNQGGQDNRNGPSSNEESAASREETVQVTLAVPQMAILGPTESGTAALDREEGNSEITTGGLRLDDGTPHPQKSANKAQLVSSNRESLANDSSLSGSKQGNEPAAAESATDASAPNRPSAQTWSRSESPRQNEFVDPPMVPIVKERSVVEPTTSAGETSGFEVVAPHAAVARLAPSPQVTLPSDLPLVNIYRNRWFTAEKPQRLPPVKEESEGSNQAENQGVWDWTPSIPLYPSTGR